VNNTATATSDNPSDGKAVVSYWVEPKANPDDLFFAMPRKRKRSGFRGLYVHMNDDFAHTLDRIGFVPTIENSFRKMVGLNEVSWEEMKQDRLSLCLFVICLLSCSLNASIPKWTGWDLRLKPLSISSSSR